MNHSTTAVTLNMQLPNIAAVTWAVQGDQLGRQLRCTLVDGSTPWNPQSGYHAVIRYFKPDGTNGVYDVDEHGDPAVTWSGNVAMVTLAQQAMTVAGTVIMQLEFYDSNDARVTAFGWAMNVQPSAVTDTEFLSTDYYNILTLQIAGVLGSSGHPPYIDSTSKNWMVWDENTAAYVDSGYSSVGMTGPAPIVTGTAYRYANSNSGTVVPTSWSSTRPATQPGTWAWTETTITFDNNTSTKFYSTAYQGNDGTGAPGTATPLMDGTATVGSATAYAREDHIHPSDTSRQETLVSGTNIKTINGNSLLGSGNIAIISGVSSVNGATGTVVLDADDVGAMSKWDLLWTNASPSSSFAAQTVSLDLSGYDAVLVTSCLATSATNQDNAMLVMVGDSARLCGTDNANNAFNRELTVLSSGVQFYSGQTGTSSQNASRIPLKIFGIKGVVTT